MDDKNYLYEVQDIEMVKKATENMPCQEEIELLSDFFKVMGDSTRLRLLMALENGELCVSDLSNVSNMTRSAVSHQLKTLKNAKLIKSRRDGKTIYYSLDDEHIHSVLKVS
ncbi:MAG: helix-turn-helix transcriptional regulator, partial [Faecalicoccus sp.]|nr:helix-turn-helix transcriptional regulator [Faecalicoccus sp.]